MENKYKIEDIFLETKSISIAFQVNQTSMNIGRYTEKNATKFLSISKKNIIGQLKYLKSDNIFKNQ